MVANSGVLHAQGSGWGWLGWCRNDKKLKIVTTGNQDPAVTAVCAADPSFCHTRL